MDYIDILAFVITGLVGGFLSGLLGVGGGIIFVPVVQHVLISHFIKDDFVSYTLANSLAIVFVVGVSGTIKQLKLKNTHLPSALITGIAAVITSLALTVLIKNNHWYKQEIFNIVFAGILIYSVIRMLLSRNDNSAEKKDFVIPPIKKFIVPGLFAGCVTSLSGLGGGIVMVPYFNRILKLPIRFSTGLSLSVIPIIAFPLLVFYGSQQPAQWVYSGQQTGYLAWPLILAVLPGAILASRFGVKYAQSIESSIIKLVFVVFASATLIKVLWPFFVKS